MGIVGHFGHAGMVGHLGHVGHLEGVGVGIIFLVVPLPGETIEILPAGVMLSLGAVVPMSWERPGANLTLPQLVRFQLFALVKERLKK